MRKQALFLLLLLFQASLLYAATPPIVIELEDIRSRHRLSTQSNEPFTLTLGQLRPGEQYKLWLNPEAQQGGAVRFISDGGAPATTYRFIASAPYQSIPVAQLSPESATTKFILSVSCSSCRRPASERSLAALTVDPDVEASTLIQDVFIGGDCFDVTNVNLIGSAESTGQFGMGAASIGIGSGVIISSGNATDAIGPNTSGSTGNNMNGDSHPDLATLAGAGAVFDASGIEFQFIPTVDSIAFRYAFASEEYCEFVDEGYNDVFGFFISGPGINGGFTGNGENIAVLPGSTIGVTIDNINTQDNALFFNPNAGSCGTTTINNDIQFDGFTTVLTAIAAVQQCETYTIRLLVGDVGDEMYDSAVFLEANSFTAGGTVTGTALSPTTNDNITYETCSDGYFSLDIGGDLSTTRTVNLFISPNSTATPDVDYASFPLSVTALPGQSTVQIPVDVFADDLVEGQESIILEIGNSCSCINGAVELIIQDSPPLDVEIPLVEVCRGETASLSATVSGGLPGFDYTWSTAASGSGITVAPNETTAYSVTVTDQCGLTATAEATVTVNALPNVMLTPPSTLTCAAQTVLLDASNSTQGDEFHFNWSTQDGQFIGAPDSLNVPVDQPGIYTLSIENMITGCADTGQVEVGLDITPPIANAGSDFVLECWEGAANLDGSRSEQGGHINYEWTATGGNLASGEATIAPLIDMPGLYTLSVTNTDNGCTAQDQVLVTQPAPDASVDLMQPTCLDDIGTIQFPQVTGGTPPYEYSIDGGATYQSANLFANVVPGNYTLIVRDDNGCTYETSGAIVQPDSTIALIEPAKATIKFGDRYTIHAQTNLADDEIGEVFWSNGSTLSCDDCLRPTASPLQTTDYLLTVIDQNGCLDQAPFRLFVDRAQTVYIPDAFSPNGDGTNETFHIFARNGTIENIRTFQVYNRWGQPVFEGRNLAPNNPTHGWDGTFRGEQVNNAVFAWLAEIVFSDGTVEVFKGNVQLIR